MGESRTSPFGRQTQLSKKYEDEKQFAHNLRNC